MNEQRLKKLFHFNENDLFANRNGRLSQNQKLRLTEAAREEKKAARDSAVILIVIAAFGFGMGLLIVVTAPVVEAKILIGLILCVLWPLGWGARAWRAGRTRTPEMANPVRSARGRVHIERAGDDFILEVEGRQFDVDQDVAQAMEEGEEMYIYFSEETAEILSVEAG